MQTKICLVTGASAGIGKAAALGLAALGAEVAGASGQYFSRRKAIRSSDVSYDQKIAQHLWEISERITSDS